MLGLLCCSGFSLVAAPGLLNMGWVAAVHELSCSVACEIFPDQGSSPCLLLWQADSLPLSHQGRLAFISDSVEQKTVAMASLKVMWMHVTWSVCLVTQSCLTLCNSMDCNFPGSSVHGTSQVRILEWVAMPTSRGSFPTQGSNPGLLHCRQILNPLSHQGGVWESALWGSSR